MKNIKQLTAVGIVVVSSVFIITACGGGGGSDSPTTTDSDVVNFTGNTNPAVIDAANTETLGKTAGEAIQHAASTEGASMLGLKAARIGPASFNSVILSLDEHTLSNRTVDLSSFFCSSGSATLTDDLTAAPAPDDPLMFTETFNECVIADYKVNGTIDREYERADSPFTNTTSIYHISVEKVSTGETLTYNGSRLCDGLGVCAFFTDFPGVAGGIHRVSLDLSDFTEDPGTGAFTGVLRVFHETFGEFTATFTDITYGSCGPSPDGGSMVITSAGSATVATITFNPDCTVTVS